MKRLIISGLAAVGMTAAVSAASAADFSPAIVFDMGGKFDKSFNQAAFEGAERFTKSSGVKSPYCISSWSRLSFAFS